MPNRRSSKCFSFPLTTLSWNGVSITKLPEQTWRKSLELLQKARVDGVMLSGYTEVEPADFNLVREAETMGAILRAEGIRVTQHHSVAPTFASPDCSNADVVNALHRDIDRAAALGAEVLVFHPGRATGKLSTVDALLQAYESEVKRIGLENLLRVCAENLHEAGEYAKKNNVRIALENVDRFEPFGDINLLPKLIHVADSECVGFCLDAGHAWCCGVNPVQWVETMSTKLFATHLHDNHGMRTPRGNAVFFPSSPDDEHLCPGFGTIDFVALIRALKQYAYAGAINFETGPWPTGGAEGYRSVIRFWKACEMLADKKRR